VQSQAEEVHELVHRFKPEILALENQLDKGDNKSPTGIALQYLIVSPYYQANRKIFHRYLHQTEDVAASPDNLLIDTHLIKEFVPKYVIGIRPEGLQSVAHYERATKGSRVVGRYKQLFPEDKHRLSQHEADSAFIGYHCGRFWATCLTNHWPRMYLTEKENHCFLEPPRSMIFRTEDAWWENQPL
jgi:hypothetical protein